MAEPLIVPTSEDAFYDQLSELSGVNYLLSFRLNQRENRWYMSVSQEDGTELVKGVKLVCNFPLLGQYVDERLPPGTLFVHSNTGDDSPPGVGDIGFSGARCDLVYSPP